MMKKILLLTLLFSLCACKPKEPEVIRPEYTYDIPTFHVDMSAYKGVNSTNHCFLGIKPSELYKCIDSKSSGIFYLGRSNCGCCQTVTRYVNMVGQELGLTVYYIDAYDPDEPLTEEDNLKKLSEYLDPILDVDEEGKKNVYTPHLFTVINGELQKGLICYNDVDFSESPTEQQIENLKGIYAEIMTPFLEETEE